MSKKISCNNVSKLFAFANFLRLILENIFLSRKRLPSILKVENLWQLNTEINRDVSVDVVPGRQTAC